MSEIDGREVEQQMLRNAATVIATLEEEVDRLRAENEAMRPVIEAVWACYGPTDYLASGPPMLIDAFRGYLRTRSRAQWP